MDMGEDVVGADGPPVLSVSSISPAGDDVELPVYSVSTPQPEPAIAVPTADETKSPVPLNVTTSGDIIPDKVPVILVDTVPS